MAKTLNILFTGGGTGGHVVPIIAIAREMKKLDSLNIKISYAGPKDALSFFLLSQEDIKIHSIVAGKIRRYFSLKNITDVLCKIPFGFFQSLFLLISNRPKLVFSKGGSGSTVLCLAATILNIPVFIHESDAVPGLSNRTAANWAKRIFISFPETEHFKSSSKTVLVGNPIRKSLLEGNRDKAKELFDLPLEKPLMLLTGGSQGAEVLNDFILFTINDLLKSYEVIHVCGIKNFKKVKTDSALITNKELEKRYKVYEFLNENQLTHAYKAADIIVSRAGSGTIFEIAALGKPSILIPLPSAAGNHQAKNAYQYAATGAATVIEQGNLTPHIFLGEAKFLLSRVKEINEAALKFARPEAGAAIAKEIIEAVS